jgi:hypothetical protein
MSTSQSHAVDSVGQSAVPHAVQRNAPEGVERALPDSVRVHSSHDGHRVWHRIVDSGEGLSNQRDGDRRDNAARRERWMLMYRSTTPTPARTSATSRTPLAPPRSPRPFSALRLKAWSAPCPRASTLPSRGGRWGGRCTVIAGHRQDEKRCNKVYKRLSCSRLAVELRTERYLCEVHLTSKTLPSMICIRLA